jgi:hypothetical protein
VPIGRAHDDFVGQCSTSVTKWVDAGPTGSHRRLASNKRLAAIDICDT